MGAHVTDLVPAECLPPNPGVGEGDPGVTWSRVMKRSFRMLYMTLAITLAVLPPRDAFAQQDPSQRLAEVLPPDVAAAVLARIEQARARELPTSALANVALEGVAKGRSAEEVLAGVELLAGDMGRAHEALVLAGRVPLAGEVEAATAAMRMGVDGETVSALARSGPSARTLAIPLLVVGGLAQRGLPADEALAAVLERLAARADDMALLRDFPEMGRGLGRAMRPEWAGPPALAPGLSDLHVPGAGPPVPVGPPVEPGPRAGRGRGRGRPPGGA